MKIVSFIAENAADALAQIHRELGPEAIVLSVRRLPAQGVARLWPKGGRIEVLAGVPDKSSASGDNPLVPGREAFEELPGQTPGRWKSVAWLEAMGLLAVHAEQLQGRLELLHGKPPPSLEAEWNLVNAELAGSWLIPPPLYGAPVSRPHVFVGPPGSGKTTALCKWLTLAMLTEERSACVWRLDGATANTAEFLTIHCEMLGAPVERFWPGSGIPADLLLIDLPGVESGDAEGLAALRGKVSALPSPRVHLVLNAACETSVLLDQCRAFAVLEPEDLVLSHLDEEARRVKLWNLVLSARCPLRFLGASQKIPGEFRTAKPELLLPAGARL